MSENESWELDRKDEPERRKAAKLHAPVVGGDEIRGEVFDLRKAKGAEGIKGSATDHLQVVINPHFL